MIEGMRENKPEVGVEAYEINQAKDNGRITLHLFFDNPSGDCANYAKFISEFEGFLKKSGYSIDLIQS